MPNDIPAPTWNESDAANTSPVPNGAPEGWFPSDVNNVYRMGMGATKRFWDHINVTETTGGIGTAYTLTYDVAPQSLWAGELYGATINVNSGTHPTLNVNALGGKSLRRYDGAAWQLIEANELMAGQVIFFYYNATALTYDIIAGFHDAPFSGGVLTSTTSMSGAAFNEAKGANIASATTTDIGAATGNLVHVTGVTTITGFGTVQAGTQRTVIFDGILTLTYDATVMILPGAADIVTAAGDSAIFESEGAGNWRCVSYQRAIGSQITAILGSPVAIPFSATYDDILTITLGPGTWEVSAILTFSDSGAATSAQAQLTDGAASPVPFSGSAGATIGSQGGGIPLGGFITNPANNLVKLRARNQSSGSSTAQTSLTGSGADTKIWARRVSA